MVVSDIRCMNKYILEHLVNMLSFECSLWLNIGTTNYGLYTTNHGYMLPNVRLLPIALMLSVACL